MFTLCAKSFPISCVYHGSPTLPSDGYKSLWIIYCVVKCNAMNRCTKIAGKEVGDGTKPRKTPKPLSYEEDVYIKTQTVSQLLRHTAERSQKRVGSVYYYVSCSKLGQVRSLFRGIRWIDQAGASIAMDPSNHLMRLPRCKYFSLCAWRVHTRFRK